MGANSSVIAGGTLTAGSNDLIINQFDTTGTLVLNTVLAGTGGLTKSGPASGGTILGGAAGSALAGTFVNTITGPITLNAGLLQANGTSVAGGNMNSGATGPLGPTGASANPVILNGGTLQLRLDGDATSATNAVSLGNAVTVNANVTINVDRLVAGSPIGGTTYLTPLNKTIQFGSLSFGNAGATLTITPADGYGVEFTGPITLNQSLTTFNVGVATASNVVQGLTLSGQVTGASEQRPLDESRRGHAGP